MTDAISEFQARPAERRAAPVTAAFIGMSGSGKTLSALRFARGLVGPNGRIVMIDTEGRRGLMYADDGPTAGFDHVDFRPPYSSERFKEAVKAQIAAGYHAIILDSASHEHEAEGGMLEYADAEARRLGDAKRVAQQKWVRPKVAHNSFIRVAISAPAHVIFCLRQKRIVDVNSNPPKVILEPVCEKSLFFDMMLAVELSDQGRAHFLKVPEPLAKHIREGEQITVDHGRLLMEEAGRGVKDDEDVSLARAALEDIAREHGTQNLATAWKALGQRKAVQLALKPELARIKLIAAETDARLAAEEAARIQPSETLLANGAPDVIPF